jgi:hypothetical protein
MIAIGVVLITLGVVLYVCSKPIFSFTHMETQTINLPPLQQSDTIMNYAFVLPGAASKQKEMQVQLTTDQTLNIVAIGNNGFYFKIVKHQPDGIDAIFLDLGKSTSVNRNWKPTLSDTYSAIFYVAGYYSSDYVTINANVTKTWTVAQTRTDTVPVTEQKPLIDFGSNFQYAIYGIAVLGVVSCLVGLTYNLRYRTRTRAQGLNK